MIFGVQEPGNGQRGGEQLKIGLVKKAEKCAVRVVEGRRGELDGVCFFGAKKRKSRGSMSIRD